MINTQLHNQLVDDMAHRITIASKGQSDKLQHENKRANLKYYFMLMLYLIVIFFLLLLLYRFYLSTELNKIGNSAQKTEQPNKIKEKQAKGTKALDDKNNLVYKNGIEYVKRDNYVYQRVWEDGILVEEIRLEETIEKSRENSKLMIPQLSIRKDGEEK